ncbi:hypothetical protein LIER_01426 [Lithospermum erythrorhizon]|uniref:WPP domain-containing protein n=1 Tax=Lithospermum erythrorhizon TaxID=34254 RepID=A0AAV3NKY8_LITER
MSESETQSNQSQFSIWPPTQRTRDAVTNRLIETLTTESVLSKRYGTVPKDEAAGLANKIEGEAFVTAGESGGKAEDDGIETLQVYSKEISKRMLDAVKSRSETNASVKDLNNDEVAVSSADDVADEKKDGVVVESDEARKPEE